MKGYPTIFEDIIFVECDVPQMQTIAPVSVDLSFKIGAQLKNLNDVKRGLANHARMQGCNCIANFKYGQKSRFLAIDDVAYFGSGIAGRLSPSDYEKIRQYIAQRDA
ncbi:MAG: hypothetical protein BWY11_00352 [Firmicutes bacterium ADurb.Bin182]|nr:MAG: hypothetical protein BWY11_00352 [Firmicutes bacterium ADurb.Bin182]